MPDQQRSKALIQTIKKIPLFKGLSPSQAQAVLRICEFKTYQATEVVCASGTSSGEMYILLSGQLGVITADGTQVATLEPVTTVGEMGIVTRQARSASVKATRTSNVIVVPKGSFDQVLRRDADFQAKIYRNIIEVLSDKIVNDNVRVRDHLQERACQERRIREYRQRAEAAMRLLAQKAGMDPDEAAAAVDNEMVDVTMRILIVDDEPAFRLLMAKALSNYDVVEAADGQEALRSVREQPPDLVITDIKMPEMDGYALLAALREEAPDLPVLAISGYVDSEDIREYYFDGFIGKPVVLDEFRQIVDDALAKDDA